MPRTSLAALLLATFAAPALAQSPAGPVFADGQAQVVPAFQDTATWIREELWVETEFDTDGDGVMPEHSVEVYEALKANGVPTQAYFHQGGHGGRPPMELMNRWFTRYLHGVENGVENDPRSWIVREGLERNDPTPYPD